MDINELERDVDNNRHKKAPFEKKYTDWSGVKHSLVAASGAKLTNLTHEATDADLQVEQYTRVIRLRSDIISAQLTTLLKEAELSTSAASSKNKKKLMAHRTREEEADNEKIDMMDTSSDKEEENNIYDESTSKRTKFERSWRDLLKRLQRSLLENPTVLKDKTCHDEWSDSFGTPLYKAWLSKVCHSGKSTRRSERGEKGDILKLSSAAVLLSM